MASNTISDVPARTDSAITQVRPNVVIGHGGASLQLLKKVGGRGVEDLEFNIASSIAVTAEGEIVVADRFNLRLQFLDKDGSFMKMVDLRDLEFKPEDVAALTNGELLVTGDGHRIHVLDNEGIESRVIQVTGAAETSTTTQGVAVDGLGRIIVTIGYQVFVLSPSGDVMLKFGDEGQDQQQLGPDLLVAVNSGNQIIISDDYNHNLKVFNPDGGHLFTCGSQGPEPGQLENPRSVITDSEDNIIVADFYNHRVSLFSPDGKFIRHVVEEDITFSDFNPTALALTPDGHLVVSEFRSMISFFKLEG